LKKGLSWERLVLEASNRKIPCWQGIRVETGLSTLRRQPGSLSLREFPSLDEKGAKRGLFSSAIVSGGRLSNFLGREFPKVSGRIQENWRFLKTRPGDPRINPLHGRSGSVIATMGVAVALFTGDVVMC
jgi:hypothetical protein